MNYTQNVHPDGTLSFGVHTCSGSLLFFLEQPLSTVSFNLFDC
ncbi:MAG: hypothetical protein AAFY48_12145 [Bacteroidota bacterium]